MSQLESPSSQYYAELASQSPSTEADEDYRSSNATQEEMTPSNAMHTQESSDATQEQTPSYIVGRSVVGRLALPVPTFDWSAQRSKCGHC